MLTAVKRRLDGVKTVISQLNTLKTVKELQNIEKFNELKKLKLARVGTNSWQNNVFLTNLINAVI